LIFSKKSHCFIIDPLCRNLLKEPRVKNIPKPLRTKVSVSVIAMMVSQAINAGAFSLYTEGSPAAIGNFAAGIAAEAADASIGWYNPAGLVLIKHQQAVLGGVGVFPSSKLTGVSTYTSIVPSSGGGIQPYPETFSGLSGAESALVPSLHYALPISETIVFGLSVVSPFGLSTDYEPTSPVRYAATRSKLETINVSPEFGWLLNDNISFGAGLDLQYARVTFNRIIGSPALMTVAGFPATAIDSQTLNSGDSFAVGFHAGMMLMFNDKHTRLGVNFQSQMNHEFNGHSTLIGRLADPDTNFLDEPLDADANATFRSNNLYSNDIPLPEIITVSGYHDLNTKWALLGSVVYTGWSPFKTISLNNIAVGLPDPDAEEPGTIIQTTANNSVPQNFRNTWRFAAGANYHVNERWMIRTGGGYDQTPTVISDRDVRLPDTNRWALSIGSHYQWRPNLGFDVGYTYLFAANDAIINNTSRISELSTYNVNAQGKSHAQLVGLQVVWKIDQEKIATK
jgi:long-chain fatty acid transport protein